MKAAIVHLVWLVLIYAVAHSQRTVVSERPQSPPLHSAAPKTHTEPSKPHVELRKHPHSTEALSSDVNTNEHPQAAVTAVNHLPTIEPEFPPEPKQKVEILHLENNMRTYDCQGQAVRLFASDAQLQFTGYCPYLVISGPNSKIQADRVQVLKVYGPDTVVSVNAVDFIDVVAPNSTVYYGRELNNSARVKSKVSGPNSIVQRR